MEIFLLLVPYSSALETKGLSLTQRQNGKTFMSQKQIPLKVNNIKLFSFKIL